MALNFTWVAPAAIRRIHVERDVVPVATPGLKRTMLRNGSSLCIYGKCFYCKSNETVCPDKKGELEGAVILYLDKHFRQYKYPWKRSYNTKVQMEWERNNDFCKKVILTLSTKRLLNLIDVSIFDFLLQNGDRHDYEVYRDKVILLDNGKGLGNPTADELDILAPLYQCCMLSSSTWQYLELLAGGSLTDVIKIMAAFQGETLATEDHYRAVERRLLKVYATVQYCIGKHGSAKVYIRFNDVCVEEIARPPFVNFEFCFTVCANKDLEKRNDSMFGTQLDDCHFDRTLVCVDNFDINQSAGNWIWNFTKRS
ncbi:hypothetical protein JYU34_003274 [Plutella xylostella]|uniref:FAM20 C-terminal domain-containing protein n=1 Tax=Plutella xylostella TaxID=51655 RepID=A0ABQ7QZM2_PLUXY|nr:hypothetical protein JYU34_003274 [Plutella xylostella]